MIRRRAVEPALSFLRGRHPDIDTAALFEMLAIAVEEAADAATVPATEGAMTEERQAAYRARGDTRRLWITIAEGVFLSLVAAFAVSAQPSGRLSTYQILVAVIPTAILFLGMWWAIWRRAGPLLGFVGASAVLVVLFVLRGMILG